ncbi:MAG TPA: endolytic transglycosylase MltG [Spirochaetota bacterium]|nr:endolytic transglycosylase MltG [Spirochaetota bacterium]
MKKLAIIGAIIAFMLVSASSVSYFFAASPMDEESKTFVVEKGSSMSKVAKDLEDAGIIRSAKFFIMIYKARGEKMIKAGKYRAYSNDTSFKLIKKIEAGEVVTAKVTIPEGYNIKQMAEVFETAGICSASDFIKYSKDKAFLKRIGIDYPTAEGYLFPETYVIAEGLDARDVISILKRKTDSVLKELNWKPKKDFSTHEMLTLASIIEKEAKVKTEQAVVSSVFHNRLKIGMPLQSCATVLYALDKTIPHLLLKDLEVDSPYNTYRHKGLTPTPIASSGLGAIKAAIKPAKTDYLFFVARNDGSHYFSKSYGSHLKAQEHYIHGEKNGFNDDQK